MKENLEYLLLRDDEILDLDFFEESWSDGVSGYGANMLVQTPNGYSVVHYPPGVKNVREELGIFDYSEDAADFWYRWTGRTVEVVATDQEWEDESRLGDDLLISLFIFSFCATLAFGVWSVGLFWAVVGLFGWAGVWLLIARQMKD